MHMRLTKLMCRLLKSSHAFYKWKQIEIESQLFYTLQERISLSQLLSLHQQREAYNIVAKGSS